MLKLVILALVTLEILLLTVLAIPSAKATSSNLEFYTWNFASVGSNQLVCKKIVPLPQDRALPSSSPMQAVSINAEIVEDRYCAQSTKPLVKER